MVHSGLSWLGRQGARAIAALVVIGIAIPSLGAFFRPYVTEAVFLLLCIAFLRLDAAALSAYVRRPVVALAATAWTSVAIPILIGVICLASGLDERAPHLFLALMLQAIASPMMAAPALAGLMGLDSTPVLVSLIASTALIPLTAPLFAFLFVRPQLAISTLALASKLSAILAGAALVGAVMRRMVGVTAIARHRESIDGVNVLVLFVFVSAVMEGVAGRFMESPLGTLALAALAFVVFFAVLFLTVIVFRSAGRDRALALGLMTSQRNMGLMLAGVGGALPDLTWLYFALSQFPIYLSPALLQRLARRTVGEAARAESGESPVRKK
jgi:BASS family bile acid:Na+ symporter